MIPTPKYYDRRAAAELLTADGIKTTAQTLHDLASNGRGPRYAIINGRAVYTRKALDEWVRRQAARPVRAAKQRKQSGALGA